MEAPQLTAEAGYEYSPLADPVFVFVERPKAPVMPDQALPPHDGYSRDASEKLFWRLASTDSCEAAHCGALLLLRTLVVERGLVVVDERSGESIVDFGMVNARRNQPFTRHIMVSREGVHVSQSGRSGKPVLTFHGDGMPRPPAHGGAMHQLVCMRTSAGRELLMDFTGPQYGLEERLPATGTPCWRCAAGGEESRGFELIGRVAPFSDRRGLPAGVLDNQMHSYIANWVKDSALGVLDHRRANRLPVAG